MATIELDIIKQRADKLLPSEKRELIEYLARGMAGEQTELKQNGNDIDLDDLPDEESELVS